MILKKDLESNEDFKALEIFKIICNLLKSVIWTYILYRIERI